MKAARRVGLNALFLDPGVSGGSETYLLGLVPELLRLAPEASFEVATSRRGAAALAKLDWANGLQITALGCDDDEPARRTVAEQLALPRLARRRGWDLVHSLSNRGPRRPGTASVVTVLDVIFFHYRTMGWVSDHGMRWAVRAAVAGADDVIAISAAAADDIAATLGVERARITPIPLGPGRDPVEPVAPEEIRRRLRLDGARVVLCVSAKRPHKNQRLIVEALPQLPAEIHAVLVGHDEGYGAELDAAARALGVAGRVRLLDYLPDAELEGLWAISDCAWFPTVAEGFGLPVLEAMRRGVPVACSDIPVLREVGGDAARYFDPRAPADAARAIAEAIGDPGAGEHGRARAAGFTWERAAAATLEVYERALGSRA
jgi:glycosyltransferase involved in cell wall biosynthesis